MYGMSADRLEFRTRSAKGAERGRLQAGPIVPGAKPGRFPKPPPAPRSRTRDTLRPPPRRNSRGTARRHPHRA